MKYLHFLIGSLFIFFLSTKCQSKFNLHLDKEPIIGKKLYYWTDTTRTDPFYGGHRVVNAQVWYPSVVTDTTTSTSEYIPKINPVYHNLNKWNAGDYRTFAGIRTKSILDNSISPIAELYPVLFFSPSLGGNTSYYTYFAETLAEKGYIVVGVNHQYESEFVLDENENIYVHSSVFHDSIEALKIPEDITADQFRALKSERMKVMAEDIIFCIDQLTLRNQADFDNRLDIGDIGAWGHSIGGGAAIYASILDERISAVIDLDGTPPVQALENGIKVPFMFIEDLTDYKNHEGYAIQYKRRADFCQKNEKESYRVIMEGIDHNSYLDIAYQTSTDENLKEFEKAKLDRFLSYMVPFFDSKLNGTTLDIQPLLSDSLEIIVFD